MTWFKRQSGDLDTSGEKKVRTEGLWVKCEDCRQIIWKKDLALPLHNPQVEQGSSMVRPDFE